MSVRALAMIGVGCLALGCWSPVERRAAWDEMGREAEVTLHTVTEAGATRGIDEIRQTVTRAMHSMRAEDPTEGLALVNRRAAEEFHTVTDHDLYRCVLLALDYAKASDGAFDPTVGPLMGLYDGRAAAPTEDELDATLDRVGWQKVAIATEARAFRFRVPGMELDLGGISSGFALDVAGRAFSRPGYRGGLISLGGSHYAWGSPVGGGDWTVPLPDPRRPDRTLVEIRTHNRGLSVSGHPDVAPGPPTAGRRPILDPLTGRHSSSDLLAAVVVADSAADADAFATAIFVAGSMRGADLLTRANRVEAVLLVRRDGGSPYLLASASLRGRLEPSEELTAETGGDLRFLLPPQRLEPI